MNMLKEFLNDKTQTTIMFDEETDLMKATVIDRKNGQVITGVYQVFSVDYLFGYDSLNTLGFWDAENQIFYTTKRADDPLFTDLSTKSVNDLNYLFNVELNKLLEIKLSGVEAKEYAKDYAQKEEVKAYLAQRRKEHLKYKVSELFYDNANTVHFDSVEFPKYLPAPYELARVIQDKTAVEEIVSRYFAKMTTEYSKKKGRYLTEGETLMYREIRRRLELDQKRNLNLTANEAKTLDFFGKLATIPQAKNVNVLYADGKNELIFSMKVGEAKFTVNVTDATIDRSAISKGWRWHEFTSDFGEKILIDNIKEVTYQREVIYRG